MQVAVIPTYASVHNPKIEMRKKSWMACDLVAADGADSSSMRSCSSANAGGSKALMIDNFVLFVLSFVQVEIQCVCPRTDTDDV